MSRLILQRMGHSDEATRGEWINTPEASKINLQPPGSFGVCVEDEPRKTKVRGETRIWASENLRLVPRFDGRYYTAAKERWGHEWVYAIEGVPDFTALLVHWLNGEEDTEGCLGLGLQMQGRYSRLPRIVAARKGYRKLIERFFFPLTPGGKGHIDLSIRDEIQIWGPPVAVTKDMQAQAEGDLR